MNKGCLISFGAFLLLATLGLGYYFLQQREKTAENYDVEKPVIMDIVKKTVATGSVKPRKEVNIKPQVSGVIDELYVEEGQIVTKGQKLARVKLIPNEININSAQSNVELAKLRVNEAKRELERQKLINSKRLDVESAKVQFENARQEEERQKSLLNEGAISQQAYNQFKLDLELAKAALDNAKIVAANSIKQFETDVDIRKQELAAAINNLQLLREGASRNSSQVANIVTSTVDGMVLELPSKEGASVIERNNFNEGTSIALIADMTELIFEGNVDESDVGKLKEGMPLELTVGAIDGEKFKATLEFIAPKGTLEEGTVQFAVRAAITPTSNTFLRAGYSANADIILDRRNQVVSIKERDVIFEDDTTFVEIKKGDREFERQQVELGLSDGIQVEIVNGLDTSSMVRIIKQS